MNLIQMSITSMSVGKNPLEKWSNTQSHQKSLKCSTWVQSEKWQNEYCSVPRFSLTVIQVYAPTSNAEEAEVEQFYEDL